MLNTVITAAATNEGGTAMVSDMENRVRVNILGEEYVVKGKASVGHIHQLGSYVNQVMSEIKQKNPCLSTMQVAILAAVNISAELHRAKEDYKDLLELLQTPDSPPISRSEDR